MGPRSGPSGCRQPAPPRSPAANGHAAAQPTSLVRARMPCRLSAQPGDASPRAGAPSGGEKQGPMLPALSGTGPATHEGPTVPDDDDDDDDVAADDEDKGEEKMEDEEEEEGPTVPDDDDDDDVAGDDEDKGEEKMEEEGEEAAVDVPTAADNVVVNDFHEEGPMVPDDDDDDDGYSHDLSSVQQSRDN
nr:nucleolin-like [Aegilops tauschii subsp. strangulata]